MASITKKAKILKLFDTGVFDHENLIAEPSRAVMDEDPQRHKDRMNALGRVDPTKPQEVARYFKEYGSRFGNSGFRGTKVWLDAVDRVAEGGPTLQKK